MTGSWQFRKMGYVMPSTPQALEEDLGLDQRPVERSPFLAEPEPQPRGRIDLVDPVRFEVLPLLFRRDAPADGSGDRVKLASRHILDPLLNVLCAGAKNADRRASAMLKSATVNAQDRIHLLAAAARRLGNAWCDDTLNFVDVTVGMARIQRLLYQHCACEDPMIATGPDRSVLITTPPGEQHIFGMSIAEYAFKTAGWSTDVLISHDQRAFKAQLAERQYSVVCLSWSGGFLKEQFLRCLEIINSMPAESRPVVHAGGHSAERNAKLLVESGVHSVCTNAFDIAAQAQQSLLASKMHMSSTKKWRATANDQLVCPA